jgi:hypothetical protein
MGLLDSLASSLDVDVDEEDLDDSPFGFDIVEEGPDGDAPDPSDAPDAPDAPDGPDGPDGAAQTREPLSAAIRKDDINA